MIPEAFQIETYSYDLPDNRIAETAAHPPESAKMLCYDRGGDIISHKHFSDFSTEIGDDTFLFLNDTRVIPSRVHFSDIPFIYEGVKSLRKGEIFFLESLSSKTFKALIFPGKHFRENTEICFPGYTLKVTGKTPEGRILEIIQWGEVSDFLHHFGKLPLPPYIEYSDEKALDYQTAFAKKEWSLAAPTASLHFSKELLDTIYQRGVSVRFLTLHVGLGTFMGMKAKDIREHIMHPEYFSVPLSVFTEIAEAKGQNKRVIAVGTTVIRTLESLGYIWPLVRERFQENPETLAFWDEATKDIHSNPFVSDVVLSESEVSGYTKLFITPGFRFLVVSEIVTNFHLPESTLMVLVSSFAGILQTKRLYEEALWGEYRFYSFGDGMWIR